MILGNRRLFLDLDGVFADFEGHFEKVFGALPPKWKTDVDHGGNSDNEEIDWKTVRDSNFFSNIPLMKDALKLWDFCKDYNPTFITGCPKIGFEEAAKNKANWIWSNIDKTAPVITCLSKDKSKICRPGDVLLDDWEHYKHLWIAKGGIWITHRNAEESISLLKIFLPIVDLSVDM